MDQKISSEFKGLHKSPRSHAVSAQSMLFLHSVFHFSKSRSRIKNIYSFSVNTGNLNYGPEAK